LRRRFIAGRRGRAFVHDVRSVVQRPDLYDLSREQRAAVEAIQLFIDENLLFMEQVLVWDKTKIPPPIEPDSANLFDEDAYWGVLPDVTEARGRDHMGLKQGYWPQYVEFARALDLGILDMVVDASGNFRRFRDVFHAWDSTNGKILFGDPWQDLARRFHAAARAVAETEVLLPQKDLRQRNAALRELAEAAETTERALHVEKRRKFPFLRS
jgi:hypothetical protein